jgi:putative FmdB family regulatory protein
MPTYVYECTRCAGRFEIQQKITDAPRKRCPSCRGTVFRVISGGGGIILKGPGFYATDYRSSDYKKKRDADRPADGGSESAASENKPSKKAASGRH